jgi:hypothetical protein
MRVEWAGQQIDVEPITTGQWYRWLVGVVVPILRGQKAEWVSDAMRILLEIVPAKTLNDYCADHSVIDLGNSIVQASSLDTSGVQAFFDVAFRATEYDEAEADGPCQCRECRALVQRDEHCLFRQSPIDEAARQLASISAELLAKFWAMPLSAYQLAKSRESAQARGQMAREQERKRKEARREIRDELLSKHGIH